MSARAGNAAVDGRPASSKMLYRWSVASRVVAAAVGGYALTTLIAIAVSLSLGVVGVNVPQTLLMSTLLGFVLYAAIVMAVFHCRSATRVWAWLAGTAIPIAIIVWLLWPRAGG